MSKYKTRVVCTTYWRPGENYVGAIVERVKNQIEDHDFLVVSEKAVSTASNNLVDEGRVEPGLNARLIARFWMRISWGYILGFMCHHSRKLIHRFRQYPREMGSRHKQLALQMAGPSQALMFGSEGGIDGTNLPYSYVSLPLASPHEVAERIRKEISSKLRKRVFVMIVDTDKTYSFRNFHFTPRPKPIVGIFSVGGVISYVLGRLFRLKRRATPIAFVGCDVSAETALEIADIANRVRGVGAGPTVWDMADRFGVDLIDVSWEMLETVKHKPIVIVRAKR